MGKTIVVLEGSVVNKCAKTESEILGVFSTGSKAVAYKKKVEEHMPYDTYTMTELILDEERE